jgi:hypothetical protein
MDHKEKIAKLVANPSLGAVTYQAYHLIEEIKALDLEGRPVEFSQTRNLLLFLTDQLLGRLWDLYPENDPLGAKGPKGFHHTRSLAEALRAVYSYMRYICRDSFRQRPRSLHFIITQLAYHYFPKENGKPLCIVRAQWHYNHKCVTLSDEIAEILPLFAFDDEGDNTPTELLKKWWANWLNNLKPDEREYLAPSAEPPLQVGVLSLGGLDDQDVFLYPLLAHEIGHFIDSSYAQPLRLKVPLESREWPNVETLRHYFSQADQTLTEEEVEACFAELAELTYDAVRELLADLIGVRLLGFSYFVSLAEYLKTMFSWSQWPIDRENGYPGMGVRLWLIHRHLTSSAHGLNLNSFLLSARDEEPQITGFLLEYLSEWERFLGEYRDSLALIDGELPYDEQNSNDTPLTRLSIRAIINLTEDIELAAKEAVEGHVQMTTGLFARVHALEANSSPFLQGDNSLSFAEVMAAAWTYEFMVGEELEIQSRVIEGQYSLYQKTCKHILEAMEMTYNSTKII